MSVSGLVFRVQLIGPRLVKLSMRYLPYFAVILLTLSIIVLSTDAKRIVAVHKFFAPTEVQDNSESKIKEDTQTLNNAEPLELQTSERSTESSIDENELTGVSDGKTDSEDWTIAKLLAIVLPGALVALKLWTSLIEFLKPLRSDSTKLMAGVTRIFGMGAYREQLDFRHRFGQDFKEVCAALRQPGQPGLIVFIDDLDRCSGKATLTILEAVNFLVTSGDCSVIMGFDHKHIENAIGHQLKDEAANADIDIPVYQVSEDGGSATIQKQQLYARYYLEKLVNLYINIPKMTTDSAANMAETKNVSTIHNNPNNILTESDKDWLQQRARWSAVRRTIYGIAKSALITSVVLLPAYFAYEKWTQASTPVRTTIVGLEESSTSDVVIDPPAVIESNTSNVTSESGESFVTFRPEPIDETSNTTSVWWWILALTILIFFLYSLIAHAMRTSALLTRDPPGFVAALKNANRLIADLNRTPRAVKRYMNRVRLASNLVRSVQYIPGDMDWIAERLGKVKPGFTRRVLGDPAIVYDKVVAISVLESLLGDYDGKMENGGINEWINAQHNKKNISDTIKKQLKDLSKNLEPSDIEIYKNAIGK